MHKVERLLDEGADVNSRIKGSTALIEASYGGRVDVVSTLISAGAMLAAQDEAGFSALHAATQEAHLGVVEILLEAGADTEQITKKGSTPLFLSSSYGYANIAEILLEHGAMQDTRGTRGIPAIYKASQKGFADVVEVLLSNGAEVDAVFLEIAATPLMAAAGHGHYTICRQLTSHGADLNLTDNYGVSALHLSVTNPEFLRIVVHLISSQASVDARDDNGESPLHWAARFGNVVAVKLLLDAGSDPMSQGEQPRPVDVICKCELHAGKRDLMKCPRKACSTEDRTELITLLEESTKSINVASKPKSDPQLIGMTSSLSPSSTDESSETAGTDCFLYEIRIQGG